MRQLLLLAVSVLSCAFLNAQIDVVVNVSGEYETCGGSFLDSGGQGGTGYSNNENFTVTICPDVPGDVITVDFVTFNLDQSGNQNSWDSMSIYDGDNTSAGTLGNYNGNALQGVFVTATPLNTTGCLTFVFQSNGTGTGAFAGGITCETPCDRPVAEAFSSVEDDNKICVDEVVTFDGSASYAAAGFNIVTYEWDFADGTPNEFSPVVSHSFAEPGEYVVELFLTDDNGCASTNRVSLQVLVATYPDFDPFPGDTTLCFGEITGEEICLEAFPNDYEVTWSGPDVTYEQSEDTELPDNVGECFQSEIEVEGFAPGQTLQDINDLLAINISVEHTWLFDLVISISCPSGESVILHQQMAQPDGADVGSNGTNLGNPPEFYDYTWSTDADQGTWSQIATTGDNDNLPEGVYNSLEPLENLVGCDLNGTWTFEVCDLWGGDDGTLDYWGLEFNPSIIPDVTEFTPQIGEDADSSFWTMPNPGLDLLSQSTDGNEVCIMAVEPGQYEYNYFLTNNHGCSHDSTITVTVTEPVLVDAGTDVTLCGGQEVNLEAWTVGTPPPPAECEFTLEMIDTFGDGWNGHSLSIMVDGVEVYNFTIENGDSGTEIFTIPGGEEFELVMNEGAFQFEVAYELFDDNGNLLFSDGEGVTYGTVFTYSCGSAGDFDFIWSPEEGLDDPTVFNPLVTATQPTTYTVSMYPEGHPVCAFTDDVDVLSAYDFDLTSIQPLCQSVDDGMINLDIDETTGTGPWTVTITQDGATIFTDAANVGDPVTIQDLPPAEYVVSVSDEGGCQYDNVIDMPQPAPIVLETVADTTVCIGGTAILNAFSELDPNSSWEYNWDNSLPEGTTHYVAPMATTTFTVIALTPQGCETLPASIQVSLYDPLDAVIPDDTLVCGGGVVDIDVSNFSGGNGEGYSWYWTFNDVELIGEIDQFSFTPDETGNVCLILNDVCETPEAQICMASVIETPLNPVFAADVNNGCAPLDVNFINNNDPSLYTSQVWNIGEGPIFIDQVPFYTYTVPGNYDVSLTITSNIGCVYEHTALGFINVASPPEPNFFATPQPTRIPDSQIEFYDTSVGNIGTYDWVFDSLQVLGTSSDKNPVFTFPQYEPGVYPVVLTITDIYGCARSITVDVIISDMFNMWIPTAFTPNQDGINEVFQVYGTDIDENRFDMQIFDRWGESVFHATDLSTPWLGDVQGGQHFAEDGVYSYRIVAHSKIDDRREEFTGTVMLIR